MDARVTKIEVVVDDNKKENARQAVVITDLTKKVDVTMTKVDSTCQKLVETAAPISNLTPAFKNFVEKVQTRIVQAESEIIELAKDVRLIRDKK